MNVPGLMRWGDVAIGAALRVGESTGESLARLRQAALPDRLTGLAERGAVERTRAADAVNALAERGALERTRAVDAVTALAERGAVERTRAVDAAIAALANSRLVDMVVEIQLDRVLALLEREPDRIRTLVRGQRESVVGDVVGRVRSGAAAGDSAVDRLTLRWIRRDEDAGPP